MFRARRTGRRVAALLLLLVLVACETEQGPASDPPASDESGGAPTADAADAALDRMRGRLAAAAEQATTAAVTWETSGGDVAVAGRGVVDASTDALSADLEVRAAPLGPGESELRVVDGVTYLRVPDLTDGAFLAFAEDDPGNPLGRGLVDQLDPRAQLRALRSGLRRVERVGDEELAGEPRERFRLVVDRAAAAGVLGPDASESELPPALTYDVWLDGRGLLRRLVVRGGETVGTLVLTYDDWGREVRVTAPLPEQVLEPLPASG